MPKYVIAKQLAGKKIITSDGEDLGKLIDLTVSETGGALQSLIVEPNSESPVAHRLSKTEDGYGVVPYDAVMAVSDYVIIDKKLLS